VFAASAELRVSCTPVKNAPLPLSGIYRIAGLTWGETQPNRWRAIRSLCDEVAPQVEALLCQRESRPWAHWRGISAWPG
jgi:hypothetical protein